MRPLLFRAYGEQTNQMHYFSIDLVTLRPVWYTNHHCSFITHKRPIDLSAPMQWIGIKGRNGNKIFELDIIERKIREKGETVGMERGLIVYELWGFTILRFGLNESYIGERPYSGWLPSCALFVTDEEFFESCSVVGNFYKDNWSLFENINTLPKIAERLRVAEKGV